MIGSALAIGARSRTSVFRRMPDHSRRVARAFVAAIVIAGALFNAACAETPSPPDASAPQPPESLSPEKLLSLLLHTKTGADKASLEAALGVSFARKPAEDGGNPKMESFHFHDSAGYVDFWDDYISGGHDFHIFIFLYNPPPPTCLTLSQVAAAFQRTDMAPFSSSTGYDHHGISYHSDQIDYTADSDGGTVNHLPYDGNLIGIPSWSGSCVTHISINSLP